MKQSVDALVYTGDGDHHGVEVYGAPLHCSIERLVSSYTTKSLRDYLADEARYGIGNYALLDKRSRRIITSTGYCGGYYFAGNRIAAATTLGDLLSLLRSEIRMDEFGLCFFLNYAPKSAFQQLPFRTMFLNIRRLPPSSVLDLRTQPPGCRSYLLRFADRPRPKSFEAALDETTTSLAAHYNREGVAPSLLFSGGVDCLSIYLSLQEKLVNLKINAIVVDHSRANGPRRAVPIAEKIDMTLEHIPDEYTECETTHRRLAEFMKREIVSGRGPHMALFRKETPPCDVLHGQNMDSVCNVNMTILQTNLDRAMLSRAKVLKDSTLEADMDQYKTFLGNLQFTGPYMNDPAYQKTTVEFYRSLHAGTVADPDPGGAGFYRGMISSQLPNLLPISRFPIDQLIHLDKEVDALKSHIGSAFEEKTTTVDLIRYLSYAALANKRTSTLSLPNGSRTIFVAMAGPILSYFVGRRRKLVSASDPKQEIYAYVKKKTGKSYTALVKVKPQAFERRKVSKDLDDLLLKDNEFLLDHERSEVIKRIGDDSVRQHVAEAYQDVVRNFKPGSDGASLYSQSRGRQMVNLELLIRAATGADGSPASPAPAS